MARIDILKRISKALTPDSTDVDFSMFDEQIADLKKKLKEKVQVKTLDDVNSQLDKFRKRIDLTPFIESLNKLKDDLDVKESEIENKLESKSEELKLLLSNSDMASAEKINEIESEIEELEKDVEELKKPVEDRITPVIEGMANLEKRLNKSIKDKEEILLSEISGAKLSGETGLTKEVNILMDKIDSLRMDMFSRLSRVGGGNANRQIFIGGVDPLKRYTDINLKAGSGMTITYANNDATKKVDITFVSAGGPGGTTRSIESTSVSSVVGSVAGTDYVVICNQGVAITLPPAVGNSNLYTIKNTAASSVLVVPDGVETIDADSEIVLSTQYTAVDLVSDGVSNWNIT
jgi:hypothetical protein